MRTQLKPFEAGAEKNPVVRDGVIKLFGYEIDVPASEILLQIDEFTEEAMAEHFDVKTAEWWVEDGWAVGKNPQMNPGMLVSKKDFFGDVILELKAKMVAPSTHDINIMICGEWTEKGRGNAYVTGLEAFWHGNIGFEKSPEYKLTVGTQLLDFDPTKEYKLQFGAIGRKVFVLVDERIALEITDPDPIDSNKYGKIGFEAFSSWWKFKDLKVYRPKYELIREYYNPEF